MQAFHGSEELKEKYVNGTYNVNECKIKDYPRMLGLPVWLAFLTDALFDGLSIEDRAVFEHDFFRAMKTGADVDSVRWKLSALRHEKQLHATKDNNEDCSIKCREAIIGAIDYLKSYTPMNHNSDDRFLANSPLRKLASACISAYDSKIWDSVTNSAFHDLHAVDIDFGLESFSIHSASRLYSENGDTTKYYKWEAEALIQLLKEAK